MNRDDALARLRPYVERARGFSGWDLSGVTPRGLEPGPPWSYEALVREYGRTATAVLDMGTGGGEFLAGVRDGMPDRVVAT
jgi:hypothetical protein